MNITGGSYMSDHFWELEGETQQFCQTRLKTTFFIEAVETDVC